jgi:hypothetical protein
MKAPSITSKQTHQHKRKYIKPKRQKRQAVALFFFDWLPEEPPSAPMLVAGSVMLVGSSTKRTSGSFAGAAEQWKGSEERTCVIDRVAATDTSGAGWPGKASQYKLPDATHSHPPMGRLPGGGKSVNMNCTRGPESSLAAICKLSLVTGTIALDDDTRLLPSEPSGASLEVLWCPIVGEVSMSAPLSDDTGDSERTRAPPGALLPPTATTLLTS